MVRIAEEIVWDTISFQVIYLEKLLTMYPIIVAILTALFAIIKRKKHRRLGQHIGGMMFTLILLLPLAANVLFGISEGADITITDLYSCDSLGNPQDYFPKKTTAYFNVSLRNLAHDPKNISIYLTVQDELNVPIGSDQLNTTIPPDISIYYIMSVFIPKWAYVGIATGYVSVFLEGTVVETESTNLLIGPEDLIPPVIRLLSPENVTYETEPIPLVFAVNERTSWIGYSLNNLENVTLAGNTTLPNLPNGSYRIIVYANDTSGNVGSSEEIYFTILIVHDVAIINIKCSPAEVYVGQIVNNTVFVKNEGTVTESFNVTTYANTTALDTLTVTDLFPSNQTTLVLTWNTTGFAKGNYTISAIADIVPSETDIIDNTYVDGIVNVMPRPDIMVTDIKPSKTSIAHSYSMSINVTVENQGDYAETFNVTTYANETIIATITNITLVSGNSITITFIWNTTDFARGNYTIWAYAWPVPGETDIEDNTLVDGAIHVGIPGDLNADGTVDIFDAVILSSTAGSELGASNWNPNADINSDNTVNIFDAVILASHAGETET